MVSSEAELIAAVNAHLAATGESATAFGLRVAGDPGLVTGIRNGRSPRFRLVMKIMAAVSVSPSLAADTPQQVA